MIKRRKKLVTIILIFVLVFATTVTAYALSSTANLQATDAGSKVTSTFSTYHPRMYTYNFSTSSDNMIAKLQVKVNGDFQKVAGGPIAPGILINTGLLYYNTLEKYRVKIYSESGNGGVNGFGTLLDN